MSDPEIAEATYEVVRGLAGGVVLMFSGFTVYHLTVDANPSAGLICALDQVLIATSALVSWFMLKRAIPVASAHVVAVSLGLLVVTDTAASVLIQGESTDLRYMQAIVVGGGAIALSSRAFAVFLGATTVIAAPVAAWVCSREEFVTFAVMQLATSMLSIGLYYGRVRSQRKLLALRQEGARTAVDLNAALVRVSHELAERERAERERRGLEEQLRQAQKLEALGTLAGGVAHDMNNVLGAVTATASAAAATHAQGMEVHQELADILSAARRGEALTRNILSFARHVPTQTDLFRVEDVVHEVEALLERTLPKNIQLAARCSAEVSWIDGDASQINHALMNLCLNSADAINGLGHIDIATRATKIHERQAEELGIAPGNYVEIAVSDTGQGIPPAALPRVFEPYFSTKEHSAHSGLGLAMVYGTVQRHQGAVSLRSEVGRGTTVAILLPAQAAPRSESKPRRNLAPDVDQTRNILLFVDDEPVLRRAGQRIGRGLGFDVLVASDGHAALEVYHQHRSRIGAVVLDVAMPVMNGSECFHALRAMDSSLPIVLATGYAKDQDIQTLVDGAHVRFLRKPYDRDDFAEALAEVLPGSERHLSTRPSRVRPPSTRPTAPSKSTIPARGS